MARCPRRIDRIATPADNGIDSIQRANCALNNECNSECGRGREAAKMDDPRFDESHLHSPRCQQYQQAREEVFAAIGSVTRDLEREFHVLRLPVGFVLQPARYALWDLRQGRLYLLRIGLNTIGRHPDNDIVINDQPVSRRHCVIIVHATGECEVRDTASRNKTRVGDRIVEQAALTPGDILRICDHRFMLIAQETNELPSSEASQLESTHDACSLPLGCVGRGGKLQRRG